MKIYKILHLVLLIFFLTAIFIILSPLVLIGEYFDWIRSFSKKIDETELIFI